MACFTDSDSSLDLILRVDSNRYQMQIAHLKWTLDLLSAPCKLDNEGITHLAMEQLSSQLSHYLWFCYDTEGILWETNKTWWVEWAHEQISRGRPKQPSRETRSGGKNSLQALMFLLVQWNNINSHRGILRTGDPDYWSNTQKNGS